MEKDSYDRIVEVATRLFAQKGYHGTSMREIAREVGLHVATVQQHVTSKELLYKEVFRRQYEYEYKVIQEILEKYKDLSDTLFTNIPLLKKVIGETWKEQFRRFAEMPYLERLWVYRLLENDELALEIDREFSLPLYQIDIDLLEKARLEGTISPDRIMMLLWMSGFAWLQMGYFTGRNLVKDLGEGDPWSPEMMQKYFEFIDMYVDRMIDLNPINKDKGE